MTPADTARKLLADRQRDLLEVERDIIKYQQREKELQAERLAILNDIRYLRKIAKGDD
ncbi:hypothetical protein [Bacillus sp. JJ722]|uniref:hypothetical protein n=1 Tax=Bacillus sp. JJ722 TaxID=3122973 RepID=UPI0030009E8C